MYIYKIIHSLYIRILSTSVGCHYVHISVNIYKVSLITSLVSKLFRSIIFTFSDINFLQVTQLSSSRLILLLWILGGRNYFFFVLNEELNVEVWREVKALYLLLWESRLTALCLHVRVSILEWGLLFENVLLKKHLLTPLHSWILILNCLIPRDCSIIRGQNLWSHEAAWSLEACKLHLLLGEVGLGDLKANPAVEWDCLLIVCAHVQWEVIGVCLKHVVHESSADAASLRLDPDSNPHQVAPAVHLQEACIPYNGLCIALPSYYDLVALWVPEALQDKHLLIYFPKCLPVDR